MSREFLNGRVTLHAGDSLAILPTLPENSIDSVVTDPPYSLVSITKRFGADNAAPAKSNGATGVYGRASAGFMGQKWDTGETAFNPAFWTEVLRALKPGGHMLAFGGTRTYHRLACAIEDGGFEIRDQIAWVFGSGFPKSHDASKGIDKHFGAEREIVGPRVRVDGKAPGVVGGGKHSTYGEFGDVATLVETAPSTPQAQQWAGFGTALKPAWEPIVVARKPLIGTVAANLLAWGVGAINIDGCRVEGAFQSGWSKSGSKASDNLAMSGANYARDPKPDSATGRWPANLIHDGSEEVLACFPETHAAGTCSGREFTGWKSHGELKKKPIPNDSGSAARFFYTAKADADDRLGSKHPTVKPLDLMQYLVRLVTPPQGVVLDPFAGTGTTGEAAWREGFSAILIEREAEYVADIERRMALCLAGPGERVRESAKARTKDKPAQHGPLFDEAAA